MINTKPFIIIFAAFLLLSGIIANCGNLSKVGDSEQTEQNDGDDQENNNSKNTNGPGYPDNYVQWADFSDRDHWGPYNLHDPSCLDDGEWTYCFSTDAAYGDLERTGLMVRRSKDLVNWEFVGWAFDGIPQEAQNYVTQANDGDSASGIWAPHIFKYNDTYRLYYSVSVFGSDASYIGLATSNSLEGPWQQQGAVLTSTLEDNVNAIDPSIITDQETGEQWMAYGSFFGGLYITQLDPETGKPLQKNNRGKRIAFNASGELEGAEIMYHEPTDKYYLFVAYGSLFDRYNTRVGRSEHPNGPFLDFLGNDMAKATDNYPIITAPYQFDNHSGWQGVSHVGVFAKGDTNFMMHQGRLGTNPGLMVMHLRKLTWTEGGWPVASPERYGNIEQRDITMQDVIGRWEVITLEAFSNPDAKNQSRVLVYQEDGNIQGQNASWQIGDETMTIKRDGERMTLYPSYGYDWENDRRTLIYTGLNSAGKSVWGKKIE